MDAVDPRETSLQRRLATAFAAAIAIGYFFLVMVYWSPGTDGGDRNGYLLEGKLFASGRISITPADQFEFLGNHWVENDAGNFLVKYPPGLPVIYAMIYRIGGVRAGAYWANWVSPTCAASAVFACFLIFRAIVGSFYATLGMLAVAVSPVTLVFAMTPSSHAFSMCMVTWGMLFLLRWYRQAHFIDALAAGLLLGYAATVRYSEGTLAIVILAVILLRLKDNPKTSMSNFWKSAAPLIIGWLAPLLAVAVFNLVTLRHLSGYAMTRESTAFGLSYLARNAGVMLIQLNTLGLYFFFPVAILGLILMFRSDRSIALIITAWVVPTILVYMAYYWAPRGYVLSYLRFLLPVIPGLALAAVWLLKRCLPSTRGGAILAGVIAAVGIARGFVPATVFAEDVYRHNAACVVAGQHVLDDIPAGSVIISEQRLLPHIETIGDYQSYLFAALKREYILDLTHAGSDSPQPLQPRRMREMAELATHSQPELARVQQEIIARAIGAHKRVFLVLPEVDAAYFQSLFLKDTALKTRVVDVWVEDETLMTSAHSPSPTRNAEPALSAPVKYRTIEIAEIHF